MKKDLYYILGGFPVLSHTFLYNQIQAVIKENQFNVKIITFKLTGEKIHDVYQELTERVVLTPLASGLPFKRRISLIFKAFFSLAFSAPGLLFKSFNFVKYSRNAWNGNYLILTNHFHKMNPSVYHCHFGTVARIVSHLKDIGAINAPFITSFHGMDITVFPKMYGPKFYGSLFQNGDHFTANSTYTIKKMVENGCSEVRIDKIPMSLDVSSFHYRDTFPPQGFNILTVGRLVEKKGYEFSLKAVALLKKKDIPFKYNIIGDGPLKSELQTLVKELNIENEVNFLGGLTQEMVKKYYEGANVFMLPSVTAENGDTEGQGLVLQEAQSMGVPVLATIHNGFPDSILDNSSGFLVPERDYQALYEKLILFNKEPELQYKMGKEGRIFVEAHFDSSVVVKKLIDVYFKLIGQTSSR